MRALDALDRVTVRSLVRPSVSECVQQSASDVRQQQPAAGELPQIAFPERAAVNQYCVACHNKTAKTAGLALDAINSDAIDQHPDIWEKVVRRLRARQMPPAGMPRPDEPTYDAVIASLEASLDSAAAAHPNPGRTDTFRRLNRTEYQNAIRDLLALDVDVSNAVAGG